MALHLTEPPISLRIKLDRLQTQIGVVLGSEFPNSDARAAARDLQGRIRKQRARLDHFSSYSPRLQEQLLRDCNAKLAIVTELLGFIIRSTTSRNLFELYHPFIKSAEILVDENVRLVLSSDWQYSPFTYPFGLDELPKYVLIGLPASESENVLVFPAAGHELGHNVWRAHKLKDRFSLLAEEAVYAALEANKSVLGGTFAGAKTANIRGDMIVQPIARRCLAFVLRQMEELFCDFVGLRMFGASYLFAFDYILASNVNGSRDGEYPGTKSRASMLADCGAHLDIQIPGYAARFRDETKPESPQAAFLISMADIAVAQLRQEVFHCSKIMVDDKVCCRTPECVEYAAECFRSGVPYLTQCSLGDLINAAWLVFNDDNMASSLTRQGVSLISLLTDLVVKSAEINEFKEY